MIKKALFIFISVVTVVISFVLLDAPADIPLQAWQDFRAEYGEHLMADWNSFTETPEWIRGVIIPAKHMANLGLAAPIDGYSKAKVDNIEVDPTFTGNSFADTKTHILLNYQGSHRPDTIRHEYTHTVIFDLYGCGLFGCEGVEDSPEENAMDEAFAYYYACRSKTRLSGAPLCGASAPAGG